MYISESDRAFRVKYFSVFVVSSFLALFSYAFALSLAMATYFEQADFDLVLKWMFVVILIVSALQAFFCFKILRGYPRWVSGMVLLFISCLLVSVPAIAYSPSFGLYAFTLSMPLLGLYCLNSRRYRSMLQAAKKVREEKAAGPQLKLKTSRQQTAINNRLRAESEKPLAIRRIGITLVKWICIALMLFFVGVIVMKLYFVYEGLVTGVVVGAKRYTPPKIYSFVDEPWMFGISMLSHLLAIGACSIFLKLMLLLRE